MNLVNPFMSFPAAAGGGTFSDDFDDNSIDPALWVKTDGTDVTVTEAGQCLNFASDASYSGASDSGKMTCVPSLDFTGKTLDLDVIAMPFTAGISGGMDVTIYDTSNPSLNFSRTTIQANTILYDSSDGGMLSSSSGAWDPSYSKLRILHDSLNSKWLFYTYTGGWALRFTSAVFSWDVGSCRFFIEAYIYGTSGQNKTAVVDNLITDAVY